MPQPAQPSPPRRQLNHEQPVAARRSTACCGPPAAISCAPICSICATPATLPATGRVVVTRRSPLPPRPAMVTERARSCSNSRACDRRCVREPAGEVEHATGCATRRDLRDTHPPRRAARLHRQPVAERPLREDVTGNARAAAFRDPASPRSPAATTAKSPLRSRCCRP